MSAVFLEKTTKKTSKNSSIPPSQTGKDETKKFPRKNSDTSKEANAKTGENFETVTVEEISTVEVCDSCGSDLSDVDPSAREERVLYDISYTVPRFQSKVRHTAHGPHRSEGVAVSIPSFFTLSF